MTSNQDHTETRGPIVSGEYQKEDKDKLIDSPDVQDTKSTMVLPDPSRLVRVVGPESSREETIEFVLDVKEIENRKRNAKLNRILNDE